MSHIVRTPDGTPIDMAWMLAWLDREQSNRDTDRQVDATILLADGRTVTGALAVVDRIVTVFVERPGGGVRQEHYRTGAVIGAWLEEEEL